MGEVSVQPTGKEGKYLGFVLAGEEYGIEILKVREIIGMMDITPLPQSPHYVKGVINLRGKVIPVVDLRLKFGLEASEYHDRTCIIVVEVSGASGPVLMGIVVDTVSEVMSVEASEVEEPPNLGSLDGSHIMALAKLRGGVKILLDIDRVMGIRGASWA
ncbi:MAG: chemotaxis protein CheW [Pseudomonadota bacterium]